LRRYLQENPEGRKMTDYDRIKNQYRTLHRTNALKKGRWSLYNTPQGVQILEAGQPYSTLLKDVQALSEVRLLSIMQELAQEAV
jgi:hypothetical protein